MQILRKPCETLEEIDERSNVYSIVASKMQSMQLKEAINYLFELGKFQLKEITNLEDEESPLSFRTFEKYRRVEIEKPSKWVIASICICMRLPSDISFILFQCAGLLLTASIIDSTIKCLLLNYHLMSMETIKNILNRKN